MDSVFGVDVMHIAHHGSESSTSAAYYNAIQPQVGVISVGLNQGSFRHPRRYVVSSVLLGPNRPECVKAAVLDLLLQTDDGIEGECEHCGTNAGLTVGDIFIRTDGHKDYRIQVSGCVSGENSEVKGGHGWICRFDEDVLDAENPSDNGTSSLGVCKEVILSNNERMVSRCGEE